MKHYNDISSFNKDIGVESPEHPLFSVTFGPKNDGGIEDIIFTAFQTFLSGDILHTGNIVMVKHRCIRF